MSFCLQLGVPTSTHPFKSILVTSYTFQNYLLNHEAIRSEVDQIQKYVFVILVFSLHTSVYSLLPTDCYFCALQAGVHVVVSAALVGHPLLLPVADGVGVLRDDLVHPGEGLREEHSSLKEAQVASVLGQGEYHVGHLFYR